MIICNNCGIALEENMRFCSECGAEFLSGSISVPPAQLRQPQSDERKFAATLAQAPPPAAATTRLVVPHTEGAKPRERYTNAQVIVITIAIVLVVLVAGAALTWLMFKGKDEQAQRSAPETAGLTKGGSASPPASPAVRATPPISAPAITNSSGEAEVKATLASWAAALEAHDLDTHMSYFTDTLDTYYAHRDVAAVKVRADLERAFSRYSTLSVRLSGMRVSFDQNDGSASVTLDKSWSFSNGADTAAAKTWSGSVRQKIWLRRIGGRWRITGLKDI